MKITHLILGAGAAVAVPVEQRRSSSGSGLQVQRTFSAGNVGYAMLTFNAAPLLANVAWPAIESQCGGRFNLSARPSPEVPDKFLANAADDLHLQLYTTRVSGSEAEACIVNATLGATHGYAMAEAAATKMFTSGMIGASVGVIPWAVAAAFITFVNVGTRMRIVPRQEINPLAGLEQF